MHHDFKKTLAFGLFHGYQRVADVIARWTRLSYDGPARLPGGPALVVANHGFGTIYDMNAFVLAWLIKHHGPADDTPITILSHEAAWTLGLGPWVEPAGLVKASRENALDALARGHLVLVLPGGDIDAGKDFWHRNEVLFGGRTGFAAIALEAGVPILPIVVAGAGETAFVLSNGARVARWLRLPQTLRLKTFPISISIPWGLTIGVSGMALPYLPLPAKMHAAVLEPIHPRAQEDAQSLADRVLAQMNGRMQELTRGRVPFLGYRRARQATPS